MKAATLFFSTILAFSANAEVYSFDFNHPLTLTPSVMEPAQKEGINIDGRTFTSGPVSVKFTAADYGNTHVRIYHSYDAGIDLRLYDGDAMTVGVPEGKYLKSVKFTMSFSGSATGTNDINFIPDSGEFVWEDEEWTPDEDAKIRSVEFTSAKQSRIYTMSVDVDEDRSEICEIVSSADSDRYYTIAGCEVSNISAPGIYIQISGTRASKIIVR